MYKSSRWRRKNWFRPCRPKRSPGPRRSPRNPRPYPPWAKDPCPRSSSSKSKTRFNWQTTWSVDLTRPEEGRGDRAEEEGKGGAVRKVHRGAEGADGPRQVQVLGRLSNPEDAHGQKGYGDRRLPRTGADFLPQGVPSAARNQGSHRFILRGG